MLDPIHDIVVPTDFSEPAESAIARAVSLAKLDGAAIHLVHALAVPLISAPYEISVPSAVWDGLRRGAEERLEESRKAVEAAGVANVTASVADGAEAARAIQEAVEAHDADLVVMGTHGYTGVKHAVLGSVAERTIRSLDGPVLAVKGDAAASAEPWRHIVVAIDFSVHGDAAVEAAATLARRFDATLDVLHVIELPQAYIPYAWSAAVGVELEEGIRESAMQQLASIEARLKESGLTVTVHGRPGRPADVIPEFVRETGCDLVVMGTRGNTGLSRLLLGSVAERTLREAPCSVLAVTAEEPSEDA